MKNRIWRGVALAAVVFAGSRMATGCSEAAPAAGEPVASVATQGTTQGVSPNGKGRALGQFTARVDHTTHQMVIEPVAQVALPGAQILPQTAGSLDASSWVLPDGGGTPVVNSVDLVTTSVDDAPDSGTFTAVVELRSFYTRSFANVYVQVTNVTYNNNPISGYDGTNSAPASNPLGLNPIHGLWAYSSNSATDGGSFIAANPNTKATNGARWTDTETWKFANAADQNIVYTLVVWASTSYASYAMTTTNVGYTDVCAAAGDAGSTTGGKQNNIKLGFDLQIYGTDVTSVDINNNGQMLFGSATTDGGPPVAIPSPNAPGPAFFPFWDNLKNPADGGGTMCWNTFGSEPNQVAAIEWRGLDLQGGNDANKGAVLDFEAFVHEGTGEIDTFYQTMIPGSDTSGRANGAGATVGIQNEDGTLGTGRFHAQIFDSGAGYGWVPAP